MCAVYFSSVWFDGARSVFAVGSLVSVVRDLFFLFVELCLDFVLLAGVSVSYSSDPAC
jgi:hypothetical protein